MTDELRMGGRVLSTSRSIAAAALTSVVLRLPLLDVFFTVFGDCVILDREEFFENDGAGFRSIFTDLTEALDRLPFCLIKLFCVS